VTVFSRRARRRTDVFAIVAAGLLASLAGLLVAMLQPAFLESLELWTIDVRFRARGSIPVVQEDVEGRSQALAVIDYDDRAAETMGLGRWPWNRRVHADLIEWLHAAGAKTVVPDLLFEIAARDADEDRRLVTAVRDAGNVILPFIFTPVSEARADASLARVLGRHALPAASRGDGALPGISDAVPLMPGLADAALDLGHIWRAVDRDGVLRRLPLLVASDRELAPGLGLVAALRHAGADPAAMRLVRGRGIRVTMRGGERLIPLDDRGRTWINWAGPWATRFPHYTYSWLAEQRRTSDGPALRARFAGRTVVLANLTRGSGDQGPTPLESDFPLSEVHLHVASMVLTGQFIRNASSAEAAALTAVPVILVTLAGLAGGPALILSVWAATVAGTAGVVQLAFTRGVVPPAIPLTLALGLTLALVLVARLLVIDRERRRFEAALGACLPARTVEQVRRSPGRAPELLAARRRELTVLFADVAGFSTFCQRVDPLEVQRVLREYLGAMTGAIRDHGGTLDKYMGDGILAFFGDAEPDGGGDAIEEERVRRHAANAVRAGAAMQRALGALNARWRAQGRVEHRIRVGINTGVVTVGNLGTQALCDYTVIGHEVNKAQRLEGAATAGGLLVARRTYALARAAGAITRNVDASTKSLKGLGESDDLYALVPDDVA
jgi:adenylate cyclase